MSIINHTQSKRRGWRAGTFIEDRIFNDNNIQRRFLSKEKRVKLKQNI